MECKRPTNSLTQFSTQQRITEKYKIKAHAVVWENRKSLLCRFIYYLVRWSIFRIPYSVLYFHAVHIDHNQPHYMTEWF